MDLDLTLVRCFVAVAEHGHFGRAAEALRVAQPALSRRVRRLERELGVRLFDRDGRGTALTRAGMVLLPHARTLLERADLAIAETRAAVTPERIVIGYADALYVTPIVLALREQFPDSEISSLHLAWNQPRSALLDRRVDAALARTPIAPDQLRIRRLRAEARVVVTARDHPLSGRASVSVADLAEYPVARLRDADPEFAAFWRVDPRPDGRPALLGPEVATSEDRFELVASGEAVAIATVAVSQATLRPDLVAIPIGDIDPVHVVVASRANDTRPAIAAIHGLAARHFSQRPPSARTGRTVQDRAASDSVAQVRRE